MLYSPPLEEQKYWEKWNQFRDPDAGDKLVQKYMPLVSYHVQRISVGLPRNVSRDELKSLGLIGLLDALDKFDLSRNLKFETYASFRIRGAIIDGLRREDWLPRSTREKAKKIETTVELLEQRYMRNVTPEEIAMELDIPVEDVYKTFNEYFFANILSMDEVIPDHDDNESLSISIKDDYSPDPEAQLVKNEWLKEMAEMISTLTANEQLVLSLFYHEELTFTEIGEVLNLSTSRISQIHSKALMKLKTLLLKKQ